jgi:hypothetical protein
MPACPICGENFSRFTIDAHVNQCLDIGAVEVPTSLSVSEMKLLGERQLHMSRGRQASPEDGGMLWVKLSELSLTQLPVGSATRPEVVIEAVFEGTVARASLPLVADATGFCGTAAVEFSFPVPMLYAPSTLQLRVKAKVGRSHHFEALGEVPAGTALAGHSTAADESRRSLSSSAHIFSLLDSVAVLRSRVLRMQARLTRVRASLCSWRQGTTAASLTVVNWAGCSEKQPPVEIPPALGGGISPAQSPGLTFPPYSAGLQTTGISAPSEGLLPSLVQALCCCGTSEAVAPLTSQLCVNVQLAFLRAADVFRDVAVTGLVRAASPPARPRDAIPPVFCTPGIHSAVRAGAGALVMSLVNAHGHCSLLGRTPLCPLRVHLSGCCFDSLPSTTVAPRVVATWGHLTPLDVAVLAGDARMTAALVMLSPPSPRASLWTGLHAVHYAVIGGNADCVQLVRDAVNAYDAVLARSVPQAPQRRPTPLQARRGPDQGRRTVAPSLLRSRQADLEALYAALNWAAPGDPLWGVDPALLRLQQATNGPTLKLPPPDRVSRIQRELAALSRNWDAQARVAKAAYEARGSAASSAIPSVGPSSTSGKVLCSTCTSALRYASFLSALVPSAHREEGRGVSTMQAAGTPHSPLAHAPPSADGGARALVGSLNCSDARGRSPVMYAAAMGRIDLVRALAAGTASDSALLFPPLDDDRDSALSHSLRCGQGAFALQLLLQAIDSRRTQLTSPCLSSRVATRVAVNLRRLDGSDGSVLFLPVSRQATISICCSLPESAARIVLTPSDLLKALAPLHATDANILGETPLLLATTLLPSNRSPAALESEASISNRSAQATAILDVLRLLVEISARLLDRGVCASASEALGPLSDVICTGDTPLHIAAKLGSASAVRIMLHLDSELAWQVEGSCEGSCSAESVPADGKGRVSMASSDECLALLLALEITHSSLSAAPVLSGSALSRLQTPAYRGLLAAMGWLPWVPSSTEVCGDTGAEHGGLIIDGFVLGPHAAAAPLTARNAHGLTPYDCACEAAARCAPDSDAVLCADILFRLGLVAEALSSAGSSLLNGHEDDQPEM